MRALLLAGVDMNTTTHSLCAAGLTLGIGSASAATFTKSRKLSQARPHRWSDRFCKCHGHDRPTDWNTTVLYPLDQRDTDVLATSERLWV